MVFILTPDSYSFPTRFSLFFQRADDPFDEVSVRHLVLVLRRVESASKSHKGPAPNGGIRLSLEGSEMDLFAARRLHDLAEAEWLYAAAREYLDAAAGIFNQPLDKVCALRNGIFLAACQDPSKPQGD
jgi:hypothetical protein